MHCAASWRHHDTRTRTTSAVPKRPTDAPRYRLKCLIEPANRRQPQNLLPVEHGQLEGQSKNVDLTPDQCRIAREFVGYTFVDMARLCATRGWDEACSRSVECLQADLTPAPIGYRRGMVAGRQLFFSHAYRLTMDPILRTSPAAFMRICWTISGTKRTAPGYFTVDDDNTPHDATKDLYGHAFVRFGLAHYAAILLDADASNWIEQTNELVFRHFRLPGGLVCAVDHTGLGNSWQEFRVKPSYAPA